MLTIDLPKEVEFQLIQTAKEKQITHSQLVEMALERLLHEQRIQRYKADLELLEQGKLKTYTAEEVFSRVRKRINEL